MSDRPAGHDQPAPPLRPGQVVLQLGRPVIELGDRDHLVGPGPPHRAVDLEQLARRPLRGRHFALDVADVRRHLTAQRRRQVLVGRHPFPDRLRDRAVDDPPLPIPDPEHCHLLPQRRLGQQPVELRRAFGRRGRRRRPGPAANRQSGCRHRPPSSMRSDAPRRLRSGASPTGRSRSSRQSG